MLKTLSLWRGFESPRRGLGLINVGQVDSSVRLRFPLSESEFQTFKNADDSDLGWKTPVSELVYGDERFIAHNTLTVGGRPCTGKSTLLALLQHTGFRCIDGDVIAAVNLSIARGQQNHDLTASDIVANFSENDWREAHALALQPIMYRVRRNYDFVGAAGKIPFINLVVPYGDYLLACLARERRDGTGISNQQPLSVNEYALPIGYCNVNYSHDYAGFVKTAAALMLMLGCSERAAREVVSLSLKVTDNFSRI